jgi:hypothetical protein
MAPFEQIEMLVASCFKVTTNSNKKERKKLANPGPTKQEFNQRLPLNAVYQQQEGAKCCAIRNQEEEDTKVQQVQQLARSNEDIDVASQ